MASKSCVNCLRALQRQSRLVPRQTKPSIGRVFTTTSARSLEISKPQPNTTPSTSIPPVDPVSAEGGHKSALDIISKNAALSNRKIGGITETYTAYGATEELYKACAAQADYKIEQPTDSDVDVLKTEDGEDLGTGGGWWHNEAGLNPTFSTWSQVTMLHIYLLSARFRAFPPDVSKIWQQHLLDHFFYDMENKMVVNHGMHARGTRNRYLKDIFVQYRGINAAYDEGLAKNDAVLAGAVWRNVFKASEEVDIAILAQIVSFMRRTLNGLEKLEDIAVMMQSIDFGGPGSDKVMVAKKSKMLSAAFEKVEPAKATTPTRK
ncbi:ubiquinol-cytochrome C chaperone-domain-containing protein [Amylocarpus encephaloides]|uniref:Ubiquinol-cytochrome C chaperone-domain-containing protein n=1 Tax=Amylocarpus encephaloides TaxID=45428 RepID=A0A9P7YFB6_9HELO|nr:ubiquinol-cytochrome C chaperone-domain-containing protein [Amylocarpus encephaloides]